MTQHFDVVYRVKSSASAIVFKVTTASSLPGMWAILFCFARRAFSLTSWLSWSTMGVTDIVRGCDLLDSTPRQLWLQQRLGLPEPRYAHAPLIINAQGQKLGKQQRSPAIDGVNAAAVLMAALGLLNQHPEPALQYEHDPQVVLQWAIQHWQPERLMNTREVIETATG
jgi:glutamyl-Q tRNA(Asp) synthetase